MEANKSTRQTPLNSIANVEEPLYEMSHIAKTALDRYFAAGSEYKEEVRAHQVNLKRMNLDLSYTTIRAPFAGIVVDTYVANTRKPVDCPVCVYWRSAETKG